MKTFNTLINEARLSAEALSEAKDGEAFDAALENLTDKQVKESVTEGRTAEELKAYIASLHKARADAASNRQTSLLSGIQKDITKAHKELKKLTGSTRVEAKESVELDENRLLKVYKLSDVEYQRAKKLKGFDKANYVWNSDEQLYHKKLKESVELDEAMSAKTRYWIYDPKAKIPITAVPNLAAGKAQLNMMKTSAMPRPGAKDYVIIDFGEPTLLITGEKFSAKVDPFKVVVK